MTKRKTMGESPFDLVVPKADGGKTAPVKAKRPARASSPPAVTPTSPRKERLTVHVTVEVVERAKNAVYWTPGLTLAGLAEDALKKAVETLEKAHGGPFDRRKGELKGGRPLK